MCSAEGETAATVTASEKDCKLQVNIGSSAHVASGGLSDSLTLFRLRGSRMMPEFTLSYNGEDGRRGILGIGWATTTSSP